MSDPFFNLKRLTLPSGGHPVLLPGLLLAVDNAAEYC